MRLLTIDGHWKVRHDERHGLDVEAGLVIETRGRWLRLFGVYGDAPGSHMIGRHWTVWPTRCGQMHGWNVRFGWWPGPCVTLLAHTRPERVIA